MTTDADWISWPGVELSATLNCLRLTVNRAGEAERSTPSMPTANCTQSMVLAESVWSARLEEEVISTRLRVSRKAL